MKLQLLVLLSLPMALFAQDNLEMDRIHIHSNDRSAPVISYQTDPEQFRNAFTTALSSDECGAKGVERYLEIKNNSSFKDSLSAYLDVASEYLNNGRSANHQVAASVSEASLYAPPLLGINLSLTTSNVCVVKSTSEIIQLLNDNTSRLREELDELNDLNNRVSNLLNFDEPHDSKHILDEPRSSSYELETDHETYSNNASDQ